MNEENVRPDYPDGAERALLALAFNYPADLSEMERHGVTPDAFYVPARRIMFAEILAQHHQGRTYDAVTVADALRAAGKLDAVGGQYGVMDACTGIDVLIPHNSEPLRRQHVDAVLTAAKRRKLTVMLEQAKRTVQEGSLRGVSDLLDAMFSLSAGEGRHFMPLYALAQPVADALEREIKAGTHVTGLRSGYPLLDDLTAGFNPGNVYVVAARPSMGKTAFGLNLVQQVAWDEPDRPGVHVAIVSAEMSASGLLRRMVGSRAGIDLRRMVQGATRGDLQALGRVFFALKTASHVDILEAHGMSVDQIGSELRLLHRDNPIGMVLVDYLQLIPGTSERAAGSMVDQINEVSQKLHEFAVSLHVPFVVLAQVNREAHGRTPSLRDLKGSSAIEQDADVVMLLDRPEKHLSDDASDAERERLRGIAVVNVAKNRNGETGRVLFEFSPELQRFTQRENQFMPPPVEDRPKTRFRIKPK